nr:beta-apo-4'-carotenal oxygenase [Quercus suber]
MRLCGGAVTAESSSQAQSLPMLRAEGGSGARLERQSRGSTGQLQALQARVFKYGLLQLHALSCDKYARCINHEAEAADGPVAANLGVALASAASITYRSPTTSFTGRTTTSSSVVALVLVFVVALTPPSPFISTSAYPQRTSFTMNSLPPLSMTSVDRIPAIHDAVVRKFHTHQTRNVEWRLKQLRALYWGLKDAEAAVLEACKLDLGKSAYETYLTELGWVLNDILFMTKNLKRFAKDEKPEDIDLINSFMSPRIRKDPLGAILIIGAYNFPIQLSLGPLVGAIAAGCTAVLKPSENATNAARVMQHIIEKSLDPDAYQCVQGAVPETTALLECKWDKIFYTGGSVVGTIIAKKAAETLTPVTLELGGRNPAIITKNADPRLAARRLLWAKLVNVGQVCVSQNYIMVDKDILPAFVAQLEVAFKEFQPKGAEHSSDYGKIINERQWLRLKSMLDSTNGKIIFGGKTDKDSLFFETTVVQVESADDPLLKDESFGPLIPILAVNDVDEAIRTANQVHATPLGLYPFGSKAETDKILSQTRSGGASVNDGFFHASIPTLSFGGVGDSGTGAYRGKASFDCFTHRRSVTTTPSWIESMLAVRYPPYTDKKLKQYKQMSAKKPDFDRNGRPTGGLIWWVMGLGGKSASGAGSRWVLVALLAVVLRYYQSKNK